ncbi:MAG: hypothetical protein LQ351_000838 [Letrouitia transgressa]|nr:MAG: hypothetical protein LQ351_000838 [Letrouitia transgressa]
MPRSRPQLSITLPKNFTFHYTEGDEPKTPERELPIAVPSSPQAYRIKRRSRPTVSANNFHNDNARQLQQDVPMPTIETPAIVEPVPSRPPFSQRSTEPMSERLAPVAPRTSLTSPRTPSMYRPQLSDGWTALAQKDIGEGISRPMSSCSIASDSSDDSDGSLASPPSVGGSCTSPESDAPDPFTCLISTRKRKGWSRPAIPQPHNNVQELKPTKHTATKWTSDMDQHLWSTYLIYLQDPVVTPFKMLPGTVPPLGVCHRVAREARRTWRGGRFTLRKPSDSASTTNSRRLLANKSDGSPDTIRASRSGSSTPTGLANHNAPPWPKSGSSTRRRLRFLCKRKPTIAPHYQRLLRSRSPSPFQSSSRSQSLLARASTPLSQEIHSTPFNTRDVQISLATSTAATMQRNGPLAQLASDDHVAPYAENDWFNDPPVPWASPPPVPSDIGLNSDNNESNGLAAPADSRQLGSPFGHHTWGPSRSRQYLQAVPPDTQSSDASSAAGPSLRSPIRLHDTFPYPSILKRRAQHQLEDELSPSGSDMGKSLIEELFGLAGNRHRRVRSRGFSLGDVNSSGGRLESLFNPPAEAGPFDRIEAGPQDSDKEKLSSPAESELIRRLGSPFSSDIPEPPRRPSRHMASASLSAFDPSNFASIDQRLRQDDLDEDFRKALRG